MDSKFDKKVKLAAGAVWAALVFFFFIYFIFLNNGNFILFSFIGFVAFSLVTFRYREFLNSAVIFSLSFIVVGTFFYMFGQEAKQFVGINLGILGYYFLISAVILVFLDMVYESNQIGRSRAAMIFGRAKPHLRKYVPYLLLVAGVAALVMPVWPLGTQLHTSLLPYIPVTVRGNGASDSGPNYIIRLNLSNYSQMVNPQSSNLAVYYANGTEIRALLLGRYSPAGNISIGINKSYVIKNGTDLRIYILAYNATFNNYFGQQSSYNASNYTKIEVMQGSLANAHLYKNATEHYSGIVTVNKTSYNRYTTFSFYFLGDACSPAADIKFSVGFTAEGGAASLFVLNNQSSLDGAVLRYNAYAPVYGYYIGRFHNYSSYSIINRTSGIINGSYNSTCIYYGVLMRNNTNVSISTTLVYQQNRTFSKVIKVPASISNQSDYLYGSYGFLPESLIYLSTLNQSS